MHAYIPTYTYTYIHVHTCIYHRFFTYGDMPLSSHLQHIDDVVLKNFSKGSPSIQVPDEIRWTEPVSPTFSLL